MQTVIAFWQTPLVESYANMGIFWGQYGISWKCQKIHIQKKLTWIDKGGSQNIFIKMIYIYIAYL